MTVDRSQVWARLTAESGGFLDLESQLSCSTARFATLEMLTVHRYLGHDLISSLSSVETAMQSKQACSFRSYVMLVQRSSQSVQM
jgi:hypothetical protein